MDANALPPQAFDDGSVIPPQAFDDGNVIPPQAFVYREESSERIKRELAALRTDAHSPEDIFEMLAEECRFQFEPEEFAPDERQRIFKTIADVLRNRVRANTGNAHASTAQIIAAYDEIRDAPTGTYDDFERSMRHKLKTQEDAEKSLLFHMDVLREGTLFDTRHPPNAAAPSYTLRWESRGFYATRQGDEWTAEFSATLVGIDTECQGREDECTAAHCAAGRAAAEKHMGKTLPFFVVGLAIGRPTSSVSDTYIQHIVHLSLFSDFAVHAPKQIFVPTADVAWLAKKWMQAYACRVPFYYRAPYSSQICRQFHDKMYRAAKPSRRFLDMNDSVVATTNKFHSFSTTLTYTHLETYRLCVPRIWYRYQLVQGVRDALAHILTWCPVGELDKIIDYAF